jgi:hypothetical protein
MISFEIFAKKIVKDVAYKLQNFYVNVHMFYTRISQARLSQVVRMIGSENAEACAKRQAVALTLLE